MTSNAPLRDARHVMPSRRDRRQRMASPGYTTGYAHTPRCTTCNALSPGYTTGNALYPRCTTRNALSPGYTTANANSPGYTTGNAPPRDT